MFFARVGIVYAAALLPVPDQGNGRSRRRAAERHPPARSLPEHATPDKTAGRMETAVACRPRQLVGGACR